MKNMLKHTLRFALTLAVLALISGLARPAAAQYGPAVDEEIDHMKKQVDEQVQKMLNSPPGVFDVEYDDNGELVRLKIKGEVEVSTALTGLRADRQARGKAERMIRGDFSKFLENNVTVSESATETFVIQEKTGQEGAEFLETSAATYTSLSNSFQRGLTMLLDHVEGEGANRRCVLVMGWSKKLNLAAMKAQAEMKRPLTEAATTGADKPADKAPAAPNNQTQTRSGDLNDF